MSEILHTQQRIESRKVNTRHLSLVGGLAGLLGLLRQQRVLGALSGVVGAAAEVLGVGLLWKHHVLGALSSVVGAAEILGVVLDVGGGLLGAPISGLQLGFDIFQTFTELYCARLLLLNVKEERL